MLTDSKITARNYAAAAEAGVLRWAAHPEVKKPDKAGAVFVAGMIGSAAHFAIPDLGRIFDDNLKGLEGQALRLPYPITTVEFFVPRIEEKLTGETPTYSPRRVVVLAETSRETILETRASYEKHKLGHMHPLPDPARLEGDDFIFCLAVCEIDGIWRPMGATWLIPATDWSGKHEGNGHGVKGEMGVLLPDYCGSLVLKHGANGARKALLIDIEAELRSALEFMEAVVCANVVEKVHETGAPAAVNMRRSRDKKLPIYETKTLTIDPAWLESHYKERVSGGASDRASPRQHLRRGHIRRIDRGTRFERPIWIPPMIVGDIERGRIDKDYRFGS